MIKRFYRFLHNHIIGVVRVLYVMPLIGVLPRNDTFFKIVVLICCAISLTIQLGNDGRWYEDD